MVASEVSVRLPSSLSPLQSLLNIHLSHDDYLFPDLRLHSLDGNPIPSLSPISLHLNSHHSGVYAEDFGAISLPSMDLLIPDEQSFPPNQLPTPFLGEIVNDERRRSREYSTNIITVGEFTRTESERRQNGMQWSEELGFTMQSEQPQTSPLDYSCFEELTSGTTSCETSPQREVPYISMVNPINPINPEISFRVATPLRSISLPDGMIPPSDTFFTSSEPLCVDEGMDFCGVHSSSLTFPPLPASPSISSSPSSSPMIVSDTVTTMQMMKNEVGYSHSYRNGYPMENSSCRIDYGIGRRDQMEKEEDHENYEDENYEDDMEEEEEEEYSSVDSQFSSYQVNVFEKRQVPRRQKHKERSNHTWEETAMQLKLPMSCYEMSRYHIPDQWLSADEYYHLLDSMERNNALYPFYDLGTDYNQVTLHPTFIYENPCPAIYFLRCEYLKNGKPMFGFPRIKNMSKLYTWKKQGFTTAVPKKNPIVRYVTANCYLCGKERYRVGLNGGSKRLE